MASPEPSTQEEAFLKSRSRFSAARMYSRELVPWAFMVTPSATKVNSSPPWVKIISTLQVTSSSLETVIFSAQMCRMRSDGAAAASFVMLMEPSAAKMSLRS